MNTQWINRISNKPIRALIAILLIVLFFQATVNSNGASIELPVFNDKIIDLSQYTGEELLAQIKTTPINSVIQLKWTQNPEHRIWIGNKSQGKLYAAVYIADLKNAFVSIAGRVNGSISTTLLRSNLGDKIYLKLLERPELLVDQPQETPAVVTNQLNKKYVDFLSKSLKLEIEPDFLFELVTFGNSSAQSKIVAETQNTKLGMALGTVGFVFLIYFIIALWQYKQRFRRA